ncbi:hypothetical protein GN958_ATG06320 [Phytophthora infestans]|uniref:Uncharacterized protein n=1 Tax=Phytophthora infestans TaxID=4787 RepID=A0A8S9UZ70_PHYIN|nr:hypothetical protein GN958_ATG06320 [Phytophthora infestans]
MRGGPRRTRREELHNFLGSQSPTSLLTDVSLAPKTADSAPHCVALLSPAVSVRFSSLPPSSVTAPLSPSNSDLDELVAETVVSPDSPVRSAPLVSPAESSAAATTAGRDETPPWFAGADQDEWEDPYSAVNLILAAQHATERPPLADPPPRVPPKITCEEPLLQDQCPVRPRSGLASASSHRSLWRATTRYLQLTWEWPENLKGVYWCMSEVSAWINSCVRIPFYKYFDRHFRGAGVSETSLCFLYSFQAACYGSVRCRSEKEVEQTELSESMSTSGLRATRSDLVFADDGEMVSVVVRTVVELTGTALVLLRTEAFRFPPSAVPFLIFCKAVEVLSVRDRLPESDVYTGTLRLHEETVEDTGLGAAVDRGADCACSTAD